MGMRQVLGVAAGVLLAGVLLGVWAWLVAPALVDAVETVSGRGGSIDFTLRVHFSYAAGLVFLGLLWWLSARPPRDLRIRLLLALLAAHLVILMGIWVLERIEFTREFAAIRFFSSGALVLASLLAWLNAAASRSDPAAHPRASWFWTLIGAAFLAAGLDDAFNLHETVGVELARWSSERGLPEHLVQDGITAGYAIGAIFFIVAFRRCFREDMLRPGQISGWLLVAGIAVYGFAVLNDSLDSLTGGVLFPANPEFAMNFLEETLEFTAAVLFVCAFAIRLYEREPDTFGRMFAAPRGQERRRLALSAAAIALLGLGLAVPASLRLFLPDRRLVAAPTGTFEVSVFADAEDGLNAVDELSWIPGLGLLAGNEGTGSVLVFEADGGHRTLASGIASPDGIVAGPSGIYVAEEERGTVSIYAPDGTKQAEIGGWETPEGVAVGSDGTLYVADLGRRLVISVRNGIRKVLASPLHGLKSPEQLALDEANNLYIADERAGAVFRVRPDGRVDTFLDGSDGIRSPEGLVVHDGHLYVSDNEASAVFRFDLGGDGGIWIDFGPKLDLAGMAFDESGAFYVAVTSEYLPANRILRIEPCPQAGCMASM